MPSIPAAAAARRGPRPALLAPLLAAALLASGCGSFGRYTPPRIEPPPALVLREPDTASRLRVAQAAEAGGQTEVALSMYGAAAAAEPGRAEVQAAFAGALRRAGNVAEAQAVLDRALARSSDHPALLLEQARLRLHNGEAEAALALLERLLARSPRDVGALDGRGVALDMLGRHAEAQASYRAALAQAPTGFAAANNLGLSLLLDGRPAEARAVLEPLARRPGAPPRVRVNLAVARAATGDEAGARDLLGEEAATLDLRSLRATLGGGGRGPVLEDAAAPPQGGR